MWLLDGNVLCAMAIDSHQHHGLARRWFGPRGRPFATCAVTQGTLLRVHMATAADATAAAAWETLGAIAAHPRHTWWEHGFSYLEVPHRHLQGGRQVTDAWIAELARRRKARVATLDSGFAALHDDVATLIRPAPPQ